VESLRTELQDRFGRLAAPAAALFDLRRVRLLGRDAGASAIFLRNGKIEIEFGAPPTPEKLREWMKRIQVPVEFVTSGRFALRAKGSVGEAAGLLGALQG
jgi:transcription-repair coupling factor (superfamily II helicase)